MKAEHLKKFFPRKGDPDAVDLNTRLEELKSQGGTNGVLKKLATEAATGIIGDEKDLRRRKQVFGRNVKPLAQQATFIESIKQTAQDRVWWVATGSAAVATIGNALTWDIEGLGEGLAIIIAIALIIIVTSLADWLKDRRFVELQSYIKDETVPVVRGKFGATQSVNVWDLVVGDIILLETGARVPADCLALEAADLQVNEQPDADGGAGGRRNKSAVGSGTDSSGGDPFLLADSVVARGQCKALVCCVGAASTRGIKGDKLDTESDTALQAKLKNLTNQFITMALVAAFAIFVLLLIVFIFSLWGSLEAKEDEKGPVGLVLAVLP